MTHPRWAAPGQRPVALVLRALGLGDLLAGVPALRGVRRALPEHRLVLATSPGYKSLIGLIGGVDEVLVTHELDPLPVPPGVVDVAVDLHGKGPRSQPVLQALRPRRLVAFTCPEVGVEGPRWRADEHEVRRWCRLVGESFGLQVETTDLLLSAPDATPIEAGAVVLHPGAAYAARRWPAERWATVARALIGDGHRILVTGSADERGLALRIAEQAGLHRDAVVAGRTDTGALAALVASSRLVLSGDTGVAHLASAFGVASVVLFGPIPPRWWGPPESGPHVALWHGDGVGDPWGSQPDPALLRIDVDEVVAHARASLARQSTGVSA